jgi:hypothetical protein
MWTLKVSQAWGPEYVAVVDDVLRTLIIQIIVQALLAAVDSNTTFFSSMFWLILMYLVLGIAFYHLLFKKLFIIV